MESTITLHQFPRPKIVPNLSFFWMKVEVFMRMASIPYQIEEQLNSARSPLAIRERNTPNAAGIDIVFCIFAKFISKINRILSLRNIR